MFLQCRRMRRKTVVGGCQGREQCCHQVNTRTTVYTLAGSSQEHQQEPRWQGAEPGVGQEQELRRQGVGPVACQEQKPRSHGEGPRVCQKEEPIYQEIVGSQKQKKSSSSYMEFQQVLDEEPSWAPKPSVVYGLITAKEVARYVPPQSVLVRPEKI